MDVLLCQILMLPGPPPLGLLLQELQGKMEGEEQGESQGFQGSLPLKQQQIQFKWLPGNRHHEADTCQHAGKHDGNL